MTKQSPTIRVHSYSKINLFLYVTGKREDGYHTLKTLFCPLTLSDQIVFSFDTKGISLTSEGMPIPCTNQNIAWRAADLFFAKTGVSPRVSMHISKHIPVSAGLGGGSSNAAAVLTTLQHFFNFPLSDDDIHSLATSIGADVPFFLQEKPAYAEGIGDLLTPVSNLSFYWVLLVCATYGVSTAEVYKNLTFPLTKSQKHPMNPLLKDAALDPALFLHNDLESVTFQLHPSLRSQKEQLLSLGANGALMSGSGPTLFGLFSSKEAAEEARFAWKGDEQLILTQLKL